MPVDLQETRLPGVGTKFTIRPAAGGRLSIIVHNDGKRELYWFRRADQDEPDAVITLDDDESRQLGAVIGGAYERPKIVEDLEMALGEMHIEWIRVPGLEPVDRQVARRGRLPREARHHCDRDSPRARIGLRRAAGGRRAARRHARHGRQGRPVPALPEDAGGRARRVLLMPGDYPTVTPYLYYEDAGAAMDWLVKAFGFEERMRMENDQGRVGHGELLIGDGLVMVGEPGSGYENPNKRGGRSTSGVNVYVDDVDAHYERAKAAGATINEEPSDQGTGTAATSRRTWKDTTGSSHSPWARPLDVGASLHRFAPLRGTHFFGVRRKRFFSQPLS